MIAAENVSLVPSLLLVPSAPLGCPLPEAGAPSVHSGPQVLGGCRLAAGTQQTLDNEGVARRPEGTLGLLLASRGWRGDPAELRTPGRGCRV